MTSNLEPGTAAPHSGTMCAAGAVQGSGPGPFAALRPGGGTLRNSDIAAPTAKQLSVHTISAGARLPQCPTCGPATGWELLTGTLEDLLKRRVEHREAVLHTLGITRSTRTRPRSIG